MKKIKAFEKLENKVTKIKREIKELNPDTEKLKFVHSQTIKLKASNPLIPVELNFGTTEKQDIKKFLIERMGSNLIRFVMPIPEEEFNKQKYEAQKKYDAIQQAQKIVDETSEMSKQLADKPKVDC